MRSVRTIAVVLAVVLGLGAVADAGGRARRYTYQQTYTYAVQQTTTVTAAAVDVHGFCAWLNGLRAQRGLSAVAVDGALCQDATVNSSHGFGHSFMGRARRQNAGVGALQTVQVMWTRSAAHAAALFDPTIRFIGLGQVGSVITFSAR